jgi:hypothetical protein
LLLQKVNITSMQKILTAVFILIATNTFAQVPEDAVRFSWYPQNGTARAMAIGGAIGSLGGDITSNFVNPAGIGFYRTNEATISSGFALNSIKANYRSTTLTEKKQQYNFAPAGIVIAVPNFLDEKKSSAFSFAVTQNTNFNNLVHFKGLNNYSSYSEQLAEEFSTLKTSIGNVLNSNSIAPYTSAPALYTYLIDTVSNGIGTFVKGAPEYILDAGQALQQEMTKTTKGGAYELAFTYAGTDYKKFFWGVSLGIPIINYESNTLFSETDTSSNTNNRFKSFSFNDNFTTKGAGLNVKIGVIYRPQDYIRIGLAVHTPSYMALSDSRQTSLQTELENPVGNFNASSDRFTEGKRGVARYIQSSPLKIIASGSYVFREVADVTKQKGFISADIEFVNHKGSRFSSDAEEPSVDQQAYYKSLNKVIKDIYKGNINAKLGGEVKFNTIMARLGFGYYGSPYKDQPVKVNKFTMSGGLGYRNKGFFVDLTYVYLVNNDFNIPYRVQNLQNVYAAIKQQTSNVVATVGVKF